MTRQESSKARAQRELIENPNKYKELGRKGGLAKVPKGFARLPKEKRKEIVMRSLKTRAARGLLTKKRTHKELTQGLDKSVADLLT